MKIFLALLSVAVVATLVFVTTQWNRVQGFTADIKNPDKFYALDVSGENIRVYEFTPQTEPNTTCVLIYTESTYKAPVMSCFKKKGANQ